MADVTTDVPVRIVSRPFEGYVEPASFASTAARGEILAIGSGEIPDAGAGNNALALMTWDLPINFAYVHMDTLLALTSSGSAGLNATGGRFEIFDGKAVNNRSYRANLGLQGGTAYQISDVLYTKQYAPMVPYRGVIQPLKARDQVRARIQMRNPTASASAANVSLVSRWLQFDINQVDRWEVNSALPTR